MKVLWIFSDPGGALALAPVIKNFVSNVPAKMKVLAGRASSNIASGYGIPHDILPEHLTAEDADSTVESFMPDVIVTSTGAGRSEQLFRNSAFARSIRSVVILDFWKDYSRRWLYADHAICNIKDFVMVMDEEVKREMIEEGFPEDRIVVSGHPYLEELFSGHLQMNRNHQPDSYLFLSQPSKTIGLNNSISHPLETVVNSLASHKRLRNIEVKLYVKLHPFEELSGDIRRILESEAAGEISAELVSGSENIYSILEKCGTVFGYNTIAMFEARAAGKRVISIDAVPIKASLRKAMTDSGMEFVAPEEKAIMQVLLSGAGNDRMPSNNYEGAASKCMQYIVSYSEVFNVKQ